MGGALDGVDARVTILRRLAALVPLAFVALFFAWPVAKIIRLGLSSEALETVTSPRTWAVIRFTIWQAALSTILTVVAAMPGAWALARRDFKGRALVRALLMVPFVLPTVVVATAFVSLSRSPWTAWASSGLVAILGAHVFFNYAVVARVVSAVWADMDHEVVDAGRALGASPAAVFRRVTLPLLRPALAAATAITFLFTFTSFGVVLILGGTRWSTLEVEIYRQTAQLLDLPAAAALALIQIGAVAASLLVWARVQTRKTATFRMAPRARPVPARRPRRGVVALAFAPAMLIVGLPIVALVGAAFSNRSGPGLAYFRALGTSRAGSTLFVAPTQAITNSLLFAGAAVFLALAVGGMAAVVIAASGPRQAGRRIYDTALMLPLGTSAVTLGFGLLITFDSDPVDLRSSIVIVPLAHALVGIPFVVRTLVPALRSIPPALREAAQTMGASRQMVFRRIALPLVWRSAMVGAGFAAAVSLGEFGATAFLARPQRPTVPIAIFRFLGQPGALNRGQALALSVVLMALVAAVVLVADRIGSRRPT